MAVELTQEQIDQWAALQNAMKATQTWSVEGKSAEEVKEASDKLGAMRKEKMSSPEGRTEMMGMMGGKFDEVDGGNALDADGFWKLTASMLSMQDEVCGGHWVIQQADHAAVTNHVIGIFGADGKMTKQQWMSSFPTYMSKVMPLINKA